MRITRKTGFRAGVIVAGVAAALALAAPASAASTSCTITGNYISCNTGTLYANANHWMKMRVNVPLYGTLTCYMHDADTGDIVGQASRSSWLPSWAYTEITVNGLYGRYFAVCINTESTGSGSIRNS